MRHIVKSGLKLGVVSTELELGAPAGRAASMLLAELCGRPTEENGKPAWEFPVYRQYVLATTRISITPTANRRKGSLRFPLLTAVVTLAWVLVMLEIPPSNIANYLYPYHLGIGRWTGGLIQLQFP